TGMDAFTIKALQMIGSAKVRDAFDVGKEPEQVREKYGKQTQFLQARRLVEAGGSVVTRGQAYWDTHQENFKTMAQQLAEPARGLHALVTDLQERGLEQDVTVVVGGEYGRTPKVNNQKGRDHWMEAGFVLFAGGGLRMGQVIGATGKHADRPLGVPYMPQN